MYKRPIGTWHAVLTEYNSGIAPQDLITMGISKSTLTKAANPMDTKRTLSIDHIVAIENWRAECGKPQLLLGWIHDKVQETVRVKVTFDELVDHIMHAKKEADDISTEAMRLLKDGIASQNDLEILLEEAIQGRDAMTNLCDVLEHELNSFKIRGSS